jgi:type II secretory pathway pseudopilin PulG
MRKFEFTSKFRLWRFRIEHSELRTNRSELLFQSNGFTLIEIIVLIVIAGIIIPTIVIPFATGIRSSNKPEMVATAMYLAHQKMEELMKFDYGRAPELNPGTYTLPAPPITGYTWQWVISYVNNNFGTSVLDVGYKMIQVTVTDPQGSTYNVYSAVTNFP